MRFSVALTACLLALWGAGPAWAASSDAAKDAAKKAEASAPVKKEAGTAAAVADVPKESAKAGEKSENKTETKTAAKTAVKDASADKNKAGKDKAEKDKIVGDGKRVGYIGKLVHYTTVYEDTMVEMARKNDLGFVELRAANPDVDPWLPGANVEMILPTMHILPEAPQKGIVINLPEMRLFEFAKGGKIYSHPIGIGREGLLTPVGETVVRAKKENPTWRPTPRMRLDDPTLPEVVPPGPENPLGTHVLYLGWPEYGIHGTNKPYGIGRRSSSGCIRMYPEDIARLFPTVAEGSPVTVVNQPVKAAWIDGRFYIEAHPTIAQADRMEIEGGLPTYDMGDADMALIMKQAGHYAEAIDWGLVRTVIRERRGYPIAVTGRVAGAEALNTVQGKAVGGEGKAGGKPGGDAGTRPDGKPG